MKKLVMLVLLMLVVLVVIALCMAWSENPKEVENWREFPGP
jgi:hypothetical protein